MGGRWKTRFYPFAIRRPRTHLTLAPEALWAIHRSELMRWPLSALHSLRRRGWRGLSFRIRGVTGKQSQWLKFNSRKDRGRWLETLEPLLKAEEGKISSELQTPSSSEAPALPADSPASAVVMTDPKVEPVVLLKGRPATRFQLLGFVEAKGPNRERSENGLAIRAAMMEADAVVDLNAERLPGFIRTEHRASGTAVRAVDQEGKLELKTRWFDSQIRRVRIPMLVMALVFGGVSDYVRTNDTASTSQDVEDAGHPFISTRTGSWITLAGWLTISSLTLGMSFLRWPQLVRPTAVCFLTKAGLSGLRVVSGLATVLFLVISLSRERPAIEALGNSNALLLPFVMIPVTFINILWSLSFLYFYLYLGRRAWRIDQEFRGLPPPDRSAPRSIPWSRRSIGGVAVGRNQLCAEPDLMAGRTRGSVGLWKGRLWPSSFRRAACKDTRRDGRAAQQGRLATGHRSQPRSTRFATGFGECSSGRQFRPRKRPVRLDARRRALSHERLFRRHCRPRTKHQTRRVQHHRNVFPSRWHEPNWVSSIRPGSCTRTVTFGCAPTRATIPSSNDSERKRRPCCT